jgi:amidohydrolase
MNLLKAASELQKLIVEDRRHLHQYPELSFNEIETASFAAKRLNELGYSVKEGVGRTGVVADFGKGGRKVAIRADMDALPIQEATGLPFSSKRSGVMHACGHDAHVACALAAAQVLKAEKLPGSLRFLMQPSEEFGDEEGKSGAQRMIEQGAMETVDYVIGQHVYTPIPKGTVAIMDGPVMSACDNFEITVIGKGGHGAYPHQTVDAVALTGLLLNAINHIISRKLKAGVPAVISIGALASSSDRGNVISDSVRILGTMRSFNKDVRQMLMQELDNACQLVRPLGGDYRVKYLFGYEATVNDKSVAELMRQVAADFIGPDNVLTIEPQMGSEDFSLFAKEAPGAFMFLGVGTEKPQPHHSPTFVIDESSLYLGSAILAETAVRLMKT